MKKRYEHKISLGHGADGKVRRKSFYSYKSVADAKKIAKEWSKQNAVEEFVTGSSVPISTRFSDWAVRCIETYKKNSVKPNTYFGSYYAPLRNHLLPYFGSKMMNDITQFDIQEYVNKAALKYAVNTIKKDLFVLHFIFKVAVKNKMCTTNPAEDINLPRKESKNEKKAFTQEQYDAAYSLAKNWQNGTAIMLLLETGITRSELLGLRWENLDHEKHYINIAQGLIVYKDFDSGTNVLTADGLKNRYRARTIPIVNDDLWNRLESIEKTVIVKGEEVETEYIFHNQLGKAIDPNNWEARVSGQLK